MEMEPQQITPAGPLLDCLQQFVPLHRENPTLCLQTLDQAAKALRAVANGAADPARPARNDRRKQRPQKLPPEVTQVPAVMEQTSPKLARMAHNHDNEQFAAIGTKRPLEALDKGHSKRGRNEENGGPETTEHPVGKDHRNASSPPHDEHPSPLSAPAAPSSGAITPVSGPTADEAGNNMPSLSLVAGSSNTQKSPVRSGPKPTGMDNSPLRTASEPPRTDQSPGLQRQSSGLEHVFDLRQPW